MISETHSGFPDYDGRWPQDAASLARILQGNGYATAAIGKWHLQLPRARAEHWIYYSRAPFPSRGGSSA